MNIYYEPYLYHHGIKGQQWGDRNGPPYPLSRLSLGEQMRIRKKRKLQEQNAKIRKKNSELRKKNKEKEENEHLKERQRQLKEEQKALKKGKSVNKSTEVKEEKEVKVAPVKTNKKTENTRKPLTKKDIRSMSDEEIMAAINRRKIEKELWDKDNEMIQSGAREVKSMLSDIGKTSFKNIASTAVTNVGKIAVRKMIENATGDPALAREIMPGGGDGTKKKPDENNNQKKKDKDK